MNNLFNRLQLLRELKRLAKENAAQGKPLCVMDDIVFKAMFTSDTEDSREALRRLLSACTRREISTVQVTNNDLIPAHLDAKTPRLDVHVTFNDGEAADLEMQINKSGDDLRDRAAFYMPKLEGKVQDIAAGKININSLPEDEKWCIYFKYRHVEQTAKLIEKLYRAEEGIMLAERAVAGIDRDYLKAVRKMGEIKNRMDRAQMMYDLRREFGEKIREEVRAEIYEKVGEKIRKKVRKEIYEEVLQEVRKESALEIARKMKKMGDSIEKIQAITGLPPETIERV